MGSDLEEHLSTCEAFGEDIDALTDANTLLHEQLKEARTSLAAATERAERAEAERDTWERRAYHARARCEALEIREELHMPKVEADLERALAERDAHAETIRKLREVVAWYGDEANWKARTRINRNGPEHAAGSDMFSYAWDDRGQRARTALEQTERKEANDDE